MESAGGYAASRSAAWTTLSLIGVVAALGGCQGSESKGPGAGGATNSGGSGGITGGTSSVGSGGIAHSGGAGGSGGTTHAGGGATGSGAAAGAGGSGGSGAAGGSVAGGGRAGSAAGAHGGSSGVGGFAGSAGASGRPKLPCVDLTGQYQENNVTFQLARQSCTLLDWTKPPDVFSSLTWTHAYTTDGMSRVVLDEETGTTVTEDSHVDDGAMYVHRVTASGDEYTSKVYLSAHPCNLLNPSTLYLTRETSSTNPALVKCEYWALECPSGTAECDDDPSVVCETNTDTDVNNCGACGTTCGAMNTTAIACSGGTCRPTCASGFGDCDYNSSNGCEKDVSSDASNCGACNLRCSTLGTAAVDCQKGACVDTCSPGRADCSNSRNDGCETDLTTDSTNCGACANDCVGGVCAGSQCQEQGTVILKEMLSVSALAVDQTNVYWTELLDLMTVDKLAGGTPQTIASSVRKFMPGNGVYYSQSSSDSGKQSNVYRWTPTSTETLLEDPTPSSLFDFTADSVGAVWTLLSPDSGTSCPCTLSVYARDVTDTAPRLIYQEMHSSSSLVAMTSTAVILSDSTGLAYFPRAGGTRQPLGSIPNMQGAFTTSSYLYVYNDQLWRIPVPLTGAFPSAPWYSPTFGSVAFGTDGTSVFVGGPASSFGFIDQLSDTSPPTSTPAAYGVILPPSASLIQSFAVGSDAIYMTQNGIRRVPRAP
jgi:hypothetical protein